VTGLMPTMKQFENAGLSTSGAKLIDSPMVL
jgi:hypothetical protein